LNSLEPMKCLYAMPKLPWPLDGGRAISAHQLLQGLIARGHEILLIIQHTPTPHQLSQWPLRHQVQLVCLTPKHKKNHPSNPVPHPPQSWIKNRCESFWGTAPQMATTIAFYAKKFKPHYVEVCGQEVLPWLTSLPKNLTKLWLAADDPCLFTYSLLRNQNKFKQKCKLAIDTLKLAIYERAYRKEVDVALAVSPRDCHSLKRIGGFKHVQLLRNGVDTTYFSPATNTSDTDQSAVFWGKLDFTPNIDAILHFTQNIWPSVKQKYPRALFRVVGKNPTQQIIQACQRAPGVQLIGSVKDIRQWANTSQVTVLPMTSGAGIKNKLLEAASMGRPILASNPAVNGLQSQKNKQTPWLLAQTKKQWVTQLGRLWDQQKLRQKMGRYARKWVKQYHQLSTAATYREQLIHNKTQTAGAP